MFKSTKIIELGSCAFRQPRASHSHCRFIHGYKLQAKFWFESKELDKNNWVVDFGSLKGLKSILNKQFDHTTCIAADDPVLPLFEEMVKADACDLRVMPNGTGVERIAEWCFNAANDFVRELTQDRCKCVKAEVFEHEKNSAIYEEQSKNADIKINASGSLETVERKSQVQKNQPKPVQVGTKVTNKWIDSKSTNTWGL